LVIFQYVLKQEHARKVTNIEQCLQQRQQVQRRHIEQPEQTGNLFIKLYIHVTYRSLFQVCCHYFVIIIFSYNILNQLYLLLDRLN